MFPTKFTERFFKVHVQKDSSWHKSSKTHFFTDQLPATLSVVSTHIYYKFSSTYTFLLSCQSSLLPRKSLKKKGNELWLISFNFTTKVFRLSLPLRLLRSSSSIDSTIFTIIDLSVCPFPETIFFGVNEVPTIFLFLFYSFLNPVNI